MHVLEVRNDELMDSITRQAAERGITYAAIVALIGDRFGEGEGRGAATLECPSPRDASLRLF